MTLFSLLRPCAVTGAIWKLLSNNIFRNSTPYPVNFTKNPRWRFYLAVDFPESRVVRLWQECPGRSDLRTRENGLLKVLYPGRLNDGSGADFRDAVIATSLGLQTGDIEIHTKSSQWWAHRHHLDPVYNRVVLHVVFQRDTVNPVILQNGREVPTLALEDLTLTSISPAAPPVPCCNAGLRLGHELFAEILDAAGESRFLSRSAGFQAELSDGEAGQALYVGIMAALGYSRNRYAMAELACRMPLRQLEAVGRSADNDFDFLAVCETVLLRAAGLLSRRRALPEKSWPDCEDAAAMSEKDWHFFRLRPGNSPVLRIAAMAGLLLRYREEGLLEGLTGAFNNAEPGNYRLALENALIINNYRPSHQTFHGALLGGPRAADIVINVWLPFMAAWGRADGHMDPAEKASEIYRRYPAISGNTLERHMYRQLGLVRETVKTARRQQGLLHIFKSFCAVGNCPACPVYQALKGKP
jgi:hypothetical protein